MAVSGFTVGEQNKRRDPINTVALAALYNAIFTLICTKAMLMRQDGPWEAVPWLALTAVVPGLLVRTATAGTYPILSMPPAVVSRMRER
jgi:hypothetical protein